MPRLRKIGTILALLMAAVASHAAPIITNVLVTAATGSTATISWTTNTPASSQLLYGTTPNLIYSNNATSTFAAA